MKILAIRLKNLTSIEGTVEVDFTAEPLHSAGIFAISGPTGAGKSTLLDALCLALYDKAPRFATSVESVNLADVGDNQLHQLNQQLFFGTLEFFLRIQLFHLQRLWLQRTAYLISCPPYRPTRTITPSVNT